MSKTAAEILLWLFTINLGIAFGAGLYEKILILPEWFGQSPSGKALINGSAMRHFDSGRRFWAFVTTVPLTLLTLVSIGVAWSVQDSWKIWWLAAAGVTLVERVGTFTFLIPSALKLMRADTTPLSNPRKSAVLWLRMNGLRAALSFAGWLLALRALSLSGT